MTCVYVLRTMCVYLEYGVCLVCVSMLGVWCVFLVYVNVYGVFGTCECAWSMVCAWYMVCMCLYM